MSSTLKPLPVTPRVRSISTPSVMSQSAASAGTTPQTIYFSGTSTEKEKETRWPRTAITRYNSLVSDWWLLEISSALLGAAAITALCIILREYDDKTLPQWKTVLGASLTLNTVLSVLGLVAKASLMIPVVECISQLKWAWYTKQHPLSDFHDFDEASRGVWGSIKLMWKLRGIHLAALGCVLTILTVAIDPFIQQTVLYSPRMVPNVFGESSVKAVEHMVDTDRADDITDYPSNGQVGTILEAALAWDEIEASIADVRPLCDSGNCTFSEYTTLSVCAATADVTEHLSTFFTNHSKTNLGPPWWNSSLPGGEYFTLTYNPMVRSPGPYMNITSVDLTTSLDEWEVIPFPKSIAFSGITNVIADSYAIWRSTDGEDLVVDNDTHYSKAFKAVEFTMYWCVQTYNTEVKKGIHVTKLAEKQDNYSGFKQVLAAEAYNPPNLVSKALGHNGKNFTVDGRLHASLQTYFQRIFTGDPVVGNDKKQAAWQLANASGKMLPNEVTRALGQAIFDKPGSNGLTGLTKLVQNVAVSMTNRARELSEVSIAGTSYKTEIFVDVQWVWVTMLFVFVVLSLLFFATTVIRQRSAMLWKSSSLAALHGLTPELQHSLGGLSRETSMEEQAKGIMVKLIDRGDGWRLG